MKQKNTNNGISFFDWCSSNNKSFLRDWDYSKNSVSPKDVLKGTHKSYFFVCHKCGNEYTRELHYFSVCGENGCPTCRRKIAGINRHKTMASKHNLMRDYPEIAKEFAVDLNHGETPDDICFNSSNKYQWRCLKCGHVWLATPKNRCIGKTSCPRCNKISHTSFPEQATFYYVKKAFSDAISGDRHLGIELDIFIPSIKIGIEYDGQVWHSSIEKDEKKNKLCADNNVKLFRIRERDCWYWSINDYLISLSVTSGDVDDLTRVIKELLLHLGKDFEDVDVKRDKNIIIDTYAPANIKNSIAIKYPTEAKEWHPTKNKPVLPKSISYGSGIKFWWKCSKCGYEWEATPNTRFRKEKIQGCPSCAHIVAWPGHTDLKTLYPDLMNDWDYCENNKLGFDPSFILPNSDKRACWICSKCGYRWRTTIYNRISGKGCVVCARNRQKKAVINLDTQQVFESADAAGKFYGKPKNHHIGDCCKGKSKKALGYKWRYYKIT